MNHLVQPSQLDAFIAGVAAKVAAYFQAQGYKQPAPVISYEIGKRYAKVISQDGSSCSSYAFIDLVNGDVLKSASWKVPAKHARGNLFDNHAGLKHAGPYGMAYLR